MLLERLYRGYGFVIRSQMPVPGAIALTDCDRALPDIEIGLGRALLTDPIRSERPYHYARGKLLFEMPDVADYFCEDGRRMTVEPCPDSSDEDVGDMLVATALPALLWMRGEAVLHGSAFVPDGGNAALAVCGPSGSGKSTILRAMIAQGAAAIGDDTLRPWLSNGKLIVAGLPTRYCWDSAKGPLRKSHAPERIREWAPMAAIFVLDAQRVTKSARFEKVTGVEALRILLRQRHRPRVPRLIGAEGAFLAQFGILAGCEIYRWLRPNGATTLSDEEISFLTHCARITSVVSS
jgi:hypothetical protein